MDKIFVAMGVFCFDTSTAIKLIQQITKMICQNGRTTMLESEILKIQITPTTATCITKYEKAQRPS